MSESDSSSVSSLDTGSEYALFDVDPQKYIETTQDVINFIVSTDDDDSKLADNRAVELRHLYEALAAHGADKKQLEPYKAQVYGKLELLLTECVMSQRWLQVLQLLLQLIREHAMPARLILKVAIETVMHTDISETGELLTQLINHVKSIQRVDVWEALLDYMLSLILNGDPAEASNILKGCIRQRFFGTVNKQRVQSMKLLQNAYLGLLHYQQAMQTRGHVHTLDGVADRMSGMSMQAEAEKACDLWQQLDAWPGLWDVFIEKHAQLLEMTDRKEDALVVLSKYSETDGSNANCHRYLYEYHTRHGSAIHVQLEHLQKFCDAVPSHELSLTLHKLLLQQKSASECVFVLFDLLDFKSWQHHTLTWQLLAKQLCHIASSGPSQKDQHEVKACWEMRSSWWPHYHFTQAGVAMDTDSKCCMDKAVVAAILLGKDNSYTEEVLKRLRDTGTMAALRQAQPYHNALFTVS